MAKALFFVIYKYYNVATVLTACGIETLSASGERDGLLTKLQQCLPLAVLKLADFRHEGQQSGCNSAYRLRY